VSGTGNRQKLSQPLNDGEQNHFEKEHAYRL
jgi:hypothetical protein